MPRKANFRGTVVLFHNVKPGRANAELSLRRFGKIDFGSFFIIYFEIQSALPYFVG
jgi:hypothetical protein